jgi:hypothetical protein
MVSTFRALAQFGSFDGDSSGDQATPSSGSPSVSDNAPAAPSAALASTNGAGMTVNLNIELTLPADPSGEVYDKFFAAMAKHLPVSK